MDLSFNPDDFLNLDEVSSPSSVLSAQSDEEVFQDFSWDLPATPSYSFTSSSEDESSCSPPVHATTSPSFADETTFTNGALEELRGSYPDCISELPFDKSIAKAFSAHRDLEGITIISRTDDAKGPKRKTALHTTIKKLSFKEKRTSRPKSTKGEGQVFFRLGYRDVPDLISAREAELEFLAAPLPEFDLFSAPVLPEQPLNSHLAQLKNEASDIITLLPFGPAVAAAFSAHRDASGVTVLARNSTKRQTALHDIIKRFGFSEKRTSRPNSAKGEGQVYFRLAESDIVSLVNARQFQLEFLRGLQGNYVFSL